MYINFLLTTHILAAVEKSHSSVGKCKLLGPQGCGYMPPLFSFCQSPRAIPNLSSLVEPIAPLPLSLSRWHGLSFHSKSTNFMKRGEKNLLGVNGTL